MTAPRVTVPGFRKWLKSVPQPAKLRCGDTLIRITSANNRFAEAEQSVLAMSASIVEALDGNGEVLRVFRIREDDGSEDEPALAPQQEAWPQSEQAQMAQIITAACDRASSRHEAAYKMAFTALKEMYEAQSQRLEEALARASRAEAQVLKMMRPQVREVLVEGDGDDTATTMLTQVLGGALAQMTQGNGAKQ